jgi:LysR family transcriptional regulator, regulator for metE and metH
VAVLPDWVVRQVRFNADFVTRRITKAGITRRLYAATRATDTARPFMAHLIRLARQEAVKLQRG